MSTLKTHNLQSPDAGSVNIVMAPNAGIVVAGLSTYSNQINVGSNIKLGTAGVVTATSFVGGLPITSGADNRVITASSASAIQGEANLTYDGTSLKIGGDSGVSGTWHLETYNSGGDGNAIIAGISGAVLTLQDTVSGETFKLAANGNASLYSQKGGDDMVFYTKPSGGSDTERFRLVSTGETQVKGDANPCLSVNRGSANTTNINILYNGSTRAQMSAASAAFEISAVGSSTPIKLFTNGSERFQIGTSGQLGIAGANYGTSGQFLKSTGSGSAVQWASPVVAGGVLQTVQKYATNEGGTNGTSFSSWSNLAINITPLSSSSHLWIWVNAIRIIVRSDGNEGRFIISDGTNNTEHYRLTNYDSDGNYLSFNPCLNWYWTQTHTAGTQITLTPKARSTGGDWVIWGDNGDKSYIIVQEIAQ